MNETEKKLLAFLASDEYAQAQKIAQKSIKDINIIFDKAEKYDLIVPLFKKLWAEYKDYPPCVGTLEESLFKEIESIINQEVR